MVECVVNIKDEFIFDAIVVGAGHAGCEAALVCARNGLRTMLFNLNLDSVAWTPCNPSIGGPAKGIVVREIDALGGQMAKNADKSMINIRMLNTSKGPAVRALRAQLDKNEYSLHMTETLLETPGLFLRYGLVEKILVSNGKVFGIETHFGERYHAHSVIVTAGTFMKGRIFVGPKELPAGRLGEFSAETISDSIKALGIEMGRFKTGTPARISKYSIDFSVMEPQRTSEEPLAFSHFTKPKVLEDKWRVYITRTNQETHNVITDNLKYSPLYGEEKIISGTGPRYCPSIEDKVVKFGNRDSHQLFIEPEGSQNPEYYIGGMSSSLPLEAQIKMVRSVKGLENAEIIRPAYAVEYDYVYPQQLSPTLELKDIENLYFAGQVNGTSGYEEAGAQGFVAGLNASLKFLKKESWVPKRYESYIGVLIDDLVTKGTDEPYRLLTSRAEYRLIIRNDNAHLRLAGYGYGFGLIPEKFYEDVEKLRIDIDKNIERMNAIAVKPNDELNEILEKYGTSPLKETCRFLDLLKRPQISYEYIGKFDNCPIMDKNLIEQIEIEIKYAGYIERALAEVEKFKDMENVIIPTNIDYSSVSNLATEAMQKLDRIRPLSVGQAMRIPGINPADISNLVYHLRTRKNDKTEKYS